MCDIMNSVSEFVDTWLLRWEVDEVLASLRREVTLSGRLVVVSLTGLVAAAAAVRVIKGRRERARLAKLRKKKQAERRRAFEVYEQMLSESEISSSEVDSVTSLDIIELIKQLKCGQLTPSVVLNAYQTKALEAHKKLNCLVEPLLEAQTDALALDTLDPAEKGLLYGVPVSLKDCFAIKGYDCTIGCSRYIDQPFDDDCVIAKVLKKHGAIPFVKTNIPQTMLSYESTNPIFGRTSNPHDLTRSAGGSSGGEAALIAAGGSILGVGTDIGGSVRAPAACCGICALKPTGLRISKKGKHGVLNGQTNITSAMGPMSSSVDGLILFMRAICTSEMYKLDPTIPVQPFREEILNDKRQLTIGYFEYNGCFEVIPAVARGVHEAKAALEAMGHKVVPWNFIESTASVAKDLYFSCIAADGGNELVDILKYDALDDAVDGLYRLLSYPHLVKRVVAALLRLIGSRDTRVANALGIRDRTEVWKGSMQVKALQAKVIEDWQQKGLDGIICPTQAIVAVPHGYPKHVTVAASYLNFFNIVDFPAGSLPVSTVTAADEASMEDYPKFDQMSSTHTIIKECMRNSEGLPVNVQVVTLPYQEELCLRIMKDVETSLKARQHK